MHKAGHFDALASRCKGVIDQLQLLCRGDQYVLVLQPISGTDFHDGYRGGKHGIDLKSFPQADGLIEDRHAAVGLFVPVKVPLALELKAP